MPKTPRSSKLPDYDPALLDVFSGRLRSDTGGVMTYPPVDTYELGRELARVANKLPANDDGEQFTKGWKILQRMLSVVTGKNVTDDDMAANLEEHFVPVITHIGQANNDVDMRARTWAAIDDLTEMQNPLGLTAKMHLLEGYATGSPQFPNNPQRAHDAVKTAFINGTTLAESQGITETSKKHLVENFSPREQQLAAEYSGKVLDDKLADTSPQYRAARAKANEGVGQVGKMLAGITKGEATDESGRLTMRKSITEGEKKQHKKLMSKLSRAGDKYAEDIGAIDKRKNTQEALTNLLAGDYSTPVSKDKRWKLEQMSMKALEAEEKAKRKGTKKAAQALGFRSREEAARQQDVAAANSRPINVSEGTKIAGREPGISPVVAAMRGQFGKMTEESLSALENKTTQGALSGRMLQSLMGQRPVVDLLAASRKARPVATPEQVRAARETANTAVLRQVLGGAVKQKQPKEVQNTGAIAEQEDMDLGLADLENVPFKEMEEPTPTSPLVPKGKRVEATQGTVYQHLRKEAAEEKAKLNRRQPKPTLKERKVADEANKLIKQIGRPVSSFAPTEIEAARKLLEEIKERKRARTPKVLERIADVMLGVAKKRGRK